MRCILTLCLALLAGSLASAVRAEPVPVRAVVVTMFEYGEPTGDRPGELQYWVERSEIAERYPFPLGEYPLYLTEDGVLLICVGGGIANATASIMALGLDERFDLSRAYWLVAGIAGADPEDLSLGSAAWARAVVDGDLVYEIDAREIPDHWPYGFIPLGADEPAQGPQDVSTGWTLDTISFPLNAALADWAFRQTRDVALPDTPALKAFRAAYEGFPEAQRPPFVTVGETLSASTYWHGEQLNRWANDWVPLYAGSGMEFMTSNMEDSGTLTALHRLAREQLVDPDRVLVLRTASNFTMPPPGRTAAWSTTASYPDEGRPALEAAWRVGSAALDALLADWERFEAAPPRPTPVVFDTDMAIDDWAALLFLARHPAVDLRAITVAGSGEAHCGPGVANALALADLAAAGAAIPAACGDPVPLDGYFVFPEPWQEDMDALSGVAVPASERTPRDGHAVELIHEAITASAEPVTLLATGPLTNIAQWLERYPGDAAKVDRLVIMGGNLREAGNIIVPGFTDGHPNTQAEWNLYVDPVAADRVFAGPLAVEVVGLDVTNDVRVTPAVAAEVKARADNPAADWWDRVLDANDWFIDSGEYYYWDVLAAMTVVDPERFCRGERMPLSVAASGTDKPWFPGSDLSMPDRAADGSPRRHLDAASAGVMAPAPDSGRTPAAVCLETDAEAAFALFLDTLTTPQPPAAD
ncbi:MAG: nucleoside hydrolase [Pseudohaliea sp.]